MSRVVVVGGSGFVGTAVVTALRVDGHDVVAIRAPRIRSGSGSEHEVAEEACGLLSRHERFVTSLREADAVVNAAGLSDAGSGDRAALVGANAVLPRLIRAALEDGRVPARFVHVSSAAVQGRRPVLDESPGLTPFSPYSWSKALGERMLAGMDDVVVYRPTSVHGPGRPVTQSVVRLARSPLASVAGTGDSPTPQVLIQNVGAAAAFLAVAPASPPTYVLHPWEGLTTASFLTALSGREPLRLPVGLAGSVVRLSSRVGSIAPSALAASRRIEMLWFGQAQEQGWLTRQEWAPPSGLDAWKGLTTMNIESTGGSQ